MRPPRLIKPDVLAFCRSFASDPQPLYIPVKPAENSRANECFVNVPAHVAKFGGLQVIGWSIWQWPKVLIEAEFHCVWKQPDGHLLDITAKSVPLPRILFVPDPRRTYQGRQVDNMRRPLTHDRTVVRYCEVDALIHKELNAGELAHMHGEVPVTRRFMELQDERNNLLRTMALRYGPNYPEPINS